MATKVFIGGKSIELVTTDMLQSAIQAALPAWISTIQGTSDGITSMRINTAVSLLDANGDEQGSITVDSTQVALESTGTLSLTSDTASVDITSVTDKINLSAVNGIYADTDVYVPGDDEESSAEESSTEESSEEESGSGGGGGGSDESGSGSGGDSSGGEQSKLVAIQYMRGTTAYTADASTIPTIYSASVPGTYRVLSRSSEAPTMSYTYYSSYSYASQPPDISTSDERDPFPLPDITSDPEELTGGQPISAISTETIEYNGETLYVHTCAAPSDSAFGSIPNMNSRMFVTARLGDEILTVSFVLTSAQA